jgi:hypothetical protein
MNRYKDSAKRRGKNRHQPKLNLLQLELPLFAAQVAVLQKS